MHSAVVQKTVEIPQLQFLDLVVVPVRATTSFGTDSAENWNCRRCSSCGVVDVTVIILLVSAVQLYVSHAIQSDRVPDIPVMLTVQFLNKVVGMVVYDSCPWFDSAEQLRSSTKSSTSLVQSSGSASDSVIDRTQRRFRGGFGPFRSFPKGVESRVEQIFRALDDEEFQGSSEWRGRREFDSQVTCHM